MFGVRQVTPSELFLFILFYFQLTLKVYAISSVYISIMVYINPIQDGSFRGCSQMGCGHEGLTLLKSVTHILQ